MSRSSRVALAVTACLAAALLASGTRFDLDPFDSAELSLAAVTAGLGHPPGAPLHAALGWLLTRAPFRPLAVLAWLSLAPAAIACALPAVRAARGRGLAPIAAALVVCALPAVRAAACRVEVYALAAALAVGAVCVAERASETGSVQRASVLTGALLGLAAGANPVLAAQGAAVAWLLARSASGRREGALALAALAASAVLAVGLCYAYAFAVADRGGDAFVWSPPRDFTSLRALLTARDFARNVSLDPRTFASNAGHLLADATRAGTLPALALGAAGLSLRDGDRARSSLLAPLALAAALGAVMISANVPYRAANPDYGGYWLVPLALATAGLARAAVLYSPRALAALSALALLLAGIAVRDGRPLGMTRALATEALLDAPPHALLVLSSDHLLFPALYLQTAENLRRDVTVLNTGWASSAWAWRRATALDPTLRVDLTPGLGGAARLAAVLRARVPGRAVLAESPGALPPGAVCARGVLWSSAEGCAGAGRATSRTLALLRANADSHARGWDARIAWSTARTAGDAAAALGCAGLAARYYAAALAAPAPERRACDGGQRVPPAPDLLELSRADIERALALTLTAAR